jgi:2-oxoisovalerate dehydrogenase E1 component
LCAGQEAIPVGALAALSADDQIISTYRGHGWALASGLSLVEVLGEICHRSIGINGGRGGSPYMMAPHRRFIGENSIVGAGIPIACGVAMANQLSGNNKVVVVSVGDGAFNQGATHEGIALAACRKLPLIVICENNGWSEMTPTSLTFKIDRIAQRAAGYGIPGVTIDGADPEAVLETIKQAADRARAGRGPALIECRVSRLWGHYNNDIEHYRPKDDRAKAIARDPITLMVDRLTRDGFVSVGAVEQLRAEVRSALDTAVAQVLSSPHPDPSLALTHVFADRRPSACAHRRNTCDTRKMTYIQAVNEALRRELESRPEVIVYGEDVGHPGGVFGATRNLQQAFGADRVFDTPISESAILGSAVGAAMMGLKPIVEIMWADFLLVALDQLINQAANVRYVTNGRNGAPVVVRTQQGATPGSCAQHSQCLEALLAHIPGLRIAIPATPQDAYDLLRAAVASADPCIVFEARSLYQATADVILSNDIEPIGKARLHRPGSDAMIITWGTLVSSSLQVAELMHRDGIDVGVLDLRWLSPLDEAALAMAVKAASGRVVIAHEANQTGGFGAEIVARLHELRPNDLHAIRVGARDARMPAAPELQSQILPTVERVMEAVRNVVRGR